MSKSIAVEIIATRIQEIRSRKVILDRDLAKLYGVETKQLIRQVRRNIQRFPVDFMYQLSKHEFANLRCQFDTSSWGGRRYLPYAFTEQGVAMLSSILNSERAIHVNILIMCAFTKIREILISHKELALKIEAFEKKYAEHDQIIREIFETIKQLLELPPVKERVIAGFKRED
ncbi:MAG: ORF6N domain-containing protein [Candidatus Omnitrophota bacterium]